MEASCTLRQVMIGSIGMKDNVPYSLCEKGDGNNTLPEVS